MFISESTLKELRGKKEFVDGLSKVLAASNVGVTKLDYDIFSCTSGIYEFLVVTYHGGVKTMRTCTYNSLSAIFTEVANLLNGGYYDEIEYYTTLKKASEDIPGLSL